MRRNSHRDDHLVAHFAGNLTQVSPRLKEELFADPLSVQPDNLAAVDERIMTHESVIGCLDNHLASHRRWVARNDRRRFGIDDASNYSFLHMNDDIALIPNGPVVGARAYRNDIARA